MFNLFNLFKPRKKYKDLFEKKQAELQKAERDLYTANSIMNQLMPEWYKIWIDTTNCNIAIIARVTAPGEQINQSDCYVIDRKTCEAIAYINYREVKEYVKSLAFNK